VKSALIVGKNRNGRIGIWAAFLCLLLIAPSAAFAQGSITGTVANSDATTPSDGDISFVGFLDDTDEEIRIESSDGAGYTTGNWYDDFQNYLTEAAGNPYDYYFVNTNNGEAYHLAGSIPSNSYQEENIILESASLPATPTDLAASAISTSSMLISWTGSSGLTYHVYRRNATSNGSYFRIDNTSGSLSDPGVSTGYFVDNTVDGSSSYTYLVIAENGSGDYSAHSETVTASSASATAPTVASVVPSTGQTAGGTEVTVTGNGFDENGLSVTFGGTSATDITVVSPIEITCATPAGTGTVDVVVTNTESGLAGTLTGGYSYFTNNIPVADAGEDLLEQYKNETITLDGSGSSDPDSDPIYYHWVQISGPETVALPDSNSVDPSFTTSTNGDYYFELIVDDGFDVSDPDTVYVEVVERAPILAEIGAQGVTEGSNLNVSISATDPDGTTPTLTAEDIPTNATFTDNGDGTGVFDFNPDYTQEGLFTVRFIASDGVAADTELVDITVADAGNQAPVLAEIGAQSVTEGDNLNFGVSATDADGTTPTFTAEDVPTNATFTDNGDGTGTFDFDPDYTQAGLITVRFIASDGVAADTELVDITVADAGNQTPVLAEIGTQNVTEGGNLNIAVSATDPDGTDPALTVENYPDNVTFTDNGDGTGTFDFNPDYTQAGSYIVRFIASDGTAADTELVSIVVGEAGNQTPVLAEIGAQSVTEGDNLNFSISATDADGTTPTLTAEDVPTNATFTDNGDGTGEFDFTPDYIQAGSYTVRFIASDGTAADTELVAITVDEAGNQAPILAEIGAQSVTEGGYLNFAISATDPDVTIPILTAEDIPTNGTFTDNGDGTGTFDFSPDYTQAGSYTVRFIASDGVAADTELVAITVDEAGNQTPVLAEIGAQSVTEGDNLNFGVSATDADATIPTLTAEDIPTNGSFTDNGDGTGTFDFTPDYTQAGSYTVRFIASDGVAADTELVAITVGEVGNQIPVLAEIGAQSVTEGSSLDFLVSATDADGTIPTLTAEDIPTNGTFTDNGDGTGTFDFTPDYTQAGSYTVRFIASDGVAADTELVEITVDDGGNQTPVLAEIGAQSVTEGDNLNFAVSATDPDATIPTLTAEDVPINGTFTDNGDGTGTFDFSPDYTQAGSYTVRFIASDGTAADTELVAITVDEAGNQTPVLAEIGAQSVTEGDNLNFAVSATDPDETIPTLTAEDIPTNATFTDNGDGTGVFDFTPDYTQVGSYTVRFIASDGVAADTELVDITVGDAGNQTPVLAEIGSQSVTEGDNLNFGVSATDADGTIPTLTAEDIPTNGTFTDNGDGTGTFDFTPDYTQAGSYTVRFIASDGVASDTELVEITVDEAGNQTPVLAEIGAQSVTEGDNLNFGVSATDPDATVPTLTAEDIPPNGTFTDNGDGTGTFDFSPDYTQAGSYTVRFIASDGTAADTELVAITVDEAGNQIPVLAEIGAQSVTEGDNLNFGVSATDPDGTTPTLTAEDLPTNATFTDNGDGTGVFDFTPDYTQVGSYTVRFIASDGVAADTELVDITVGEAGNQTPVLAEIGAQSVTEGSNLNVAISATDPDATIPTLTAEDLPTNATFTDNGDGTGTFDFTPDYTQAGSYTVRFIASDGVLADTELVDITVDEAGNQTPVLAEIGAQGVAEGGNLNFVVTATDPDATIPALTAEDVPTNGTFTDNGDGTGTFDFNPDYTQAGSYTVRFIASDGVAADTELVDITVSEEGNQAPVLAEIGAQTIAEGANLNLAITASDPDGTTLTLAAEDVPTNATFTDNGDNSGVFDFTPDYTQSGSYTVRFIASDGVLADSELVEITVTEENLAPVIADVDSQFVDEGANLNFIVTATDGDGTTPTLEALNIPTNATFADNSDGTGTFDFNPDQTQAGEYTVTFVATDGVDDDSLDVIVTVNAAEMAPVIDPIANQSVNVLGELLLTVTATDPDGTIPTLSALNLMNNATFVDSGDGIGGFEFYPDATQEGIYYVSFVASDGALADTQAVRITVTDLPNQPPVFDPVDPQETVEGQLFQIVIRATDPEEDSIFLNLTDGPENSIFVDSGNGAGLYTLDPDYYQAGIDTIRIAAIDNGDPEAGAVLRVQVTIEDVNRPPVFDTISAQSVLLGDSLLLRVVATDSTDPDGGDLILATLDKPLNSVFVDSGNGIGAFNFKPTADQVGEDTVKFICYDDEDPPLSKTMIVPITIVSANQPPVLESIGPQTVTEADTLLLNIYATDVDGPFVQLYTGTLPNNATFVDSGNGVGTLEFVPDFMQAGLISIKFYATDGMLIDMESVLIQIYDNPQPPIITIPVDTDTVTEGETTSFEISAVDPDSTIPALMVDTTGLPLNTIFDDHGDGTGTFSFSPVYVQSGEYTIDFIAYDESELADTGSVLIVVLDAGNQMPVFEYLNLDGVIQSPEQTITITEADTVEFSIVTSDADSVAPVLSIGDLPDGASFTDNGDYTGSFYWETDNFDQGEHAMTIYAVDGYEPTDVESVTVTIVVENVNRPPNVLYLLLDGDIVNAADPIVISEGDTVVYHVYMEDPDSTFPVLEVESCDLSDSTIIDMHDFIAEYDSTTGGGTITLTPDYYQSRLDNYLFRVRAVDSDDSEIWLQKFYMIDVENIVFDPVLEPIETPLTVTEGDSLSVTIYYYDLDLPAGLNLTLSMDPVLENAGFNTIEPNASSEFYFYPWYDQAGTYTVTFTLTDPYGNEVPQVVEIEVVEAGPQPPILSVPFAPLLTVNLGEPYSGRISAIDPEGDAISLLAEDLPTNATFVDSGNGAGSFSFDPEDSQGSQTYEVTFIGSDGTLEDTVVVEVFVQEFVCGDVNDDSGNIDIDDIVFLISYLFQGGPAPDPLVSADVHRTDCPDVIVDIDDVTHLISYLYQGGDPPDCECP